MKKISIELFRWYSLRDVWRLERESGACLISECTRADKGAYGSTLERRLRAQGVPVYATAALED